MEVSTRILSDITVYMKYAKYVPELNRRETWEELVTRNVNMHIKKYPKLTEEIQELRDEIKSLHNECRYLHTLYSQFQDIVNGDRD